jgi:hypothetical protein
LTDEQEKKKTSRDKKTFSNDINIYNPRRRKRKQLNEIIISKRKKNKSKWEYSIY